MRDDEYCHGCHEKLPCECRTDFYDKNGKVIEHHEVKLRKQIEELKKQNEKLKSLILFTDPILSSEQCGGEIQLKQWTEFIRCFPEEGEI